VAAVLGYPSGAVERERPLRLAYLADPTELAAREWMAFFAARGHEVSVIARPDQDAAGLDSRIRVVRLADFGGRRIKPLGYVDARHAVQAALSTVQPDVLHAHYLTGYGWMARLSGFHPYVITLWGSDVYRTLPRSRKARWFGRLALRGADVLTMESHDLARRAVAAGALPGRTHVIQFGVDTRRYHPVSPDPTLAAELGLSDRRVVFSPRQIAPLYDHLAVVRAIAAMPADVVLLMSARNAVPPYRREVEDLAESLGLGGRLRIVPGIPHDDMNRYYALADVVVSVPETDSVSVCLLEAMACGRPVIASDLPSPREWLDEASPDTIVPSGDAHALASAIAAVLDRSPAERAAHANRARRLVEDRAERETNMSEMERLYRSFAQQIRAAA
jgi:glycosyltransferase involved in cell wall biosynthesis